jgi:hypothetical protein
MNKPDSPALPLLFGERALTCPHCGQPIAAARPSERAYAPQWHREMRDGQRAWAADIVALEALAKGQGDE